MARERVRTSPGLMGPPVCEKEEGGVRRISMTEASTANPRHAGKMRLPLTGTPKGRGSGRDRRALLDRSNMDLPVNEESFGLSASRPGLKI